MLKWFVLCVHGDSISTAAPSRPNIAKDVKKTTGMVAQPNEGCQMNGILKRNRTSHVLKCVTYTSGFSY